MRFTFLVTLLCIFGSVFAQDATAPPAWKADAAKVRIRENTGKLDYIRFKPDRQIPEGESIGYLTGILDARTADSWFLKNTEEDRLGWKHYRYGQTYKGVPVEYAHYYVHTKAGNVISMNGHYIPVDGPATPVLDRDYCRDQAINSVGANKYRWQFPREEQMLQLESNDPTASYFPNGELVFTPSTRDFDASKYKLAWKFDIYAVEPLSRKEIYVDAVSGAVIYENNRIHTADSNGIAETKYSGTQNITADYTGTNYRLRETGRGGGIQTFDMNQSTNYSAAVDFTDADNYWNNVNSFADEAAGDGHWAAEMTWDYYWQRHGRNSFNGSGAVMRSYLHYDFNYGNAFWDGQRMTYGDGGSGNRPFCTLDVSGHEFSHGVIQYTANLVYQDEPGALNESFADIFGVAIEWFAKPASANWLMAEDLGIFRSMSSPNSYNDPDTYFGTFWKTGSGDNGGVHSNSGVQNHWFYLLSVGGTGMNDNGESYSVTGISIDSAAVIAYRNLSVYLGASSQYDDARFYAIEAASDIFGECSPEMIATMNAWHAVGVGTPFGPLSAGFIEDETSFCNAPARVQFTNQSIGALSYFWDFDDGSFSTAVNPSHSFPFFGTYNPTMIAYGCSTLVDTVVSVNTIVVNANQPCTINMPQSGSGGSLAACDGRLLDSGGNQDYLPNTNSSVTIAPVGASTIELTFLSFDYVMGGDFIAIYDGADASAPLIGLYNGTTLPNGGVITSTGGSLHIVERSNGVNENAGFEAMWSCLVNTDEPLIENGLMQVFPNPTEGVFTLRLEDLAMGSASILVYDAYGKSIKEIPANITRNFEQNIDLSGYAKGIYFVEVLGADFRKTAKIILK